VTAVSALRIVHLCAPAGVGGLERIVEGLGAGLNDRGHEVSVAAVVDPGVDDPPFLKTLEAAGVRVDRVKVRGRGYLREVRQVRALLRAQAPQVLHTHGYRSDLLHGAFARRTGIATVSTLHGSSRMGGASRFFEWAQERALRDFDAVIAVSPPLADQLEAGGVPGHRIHRVSNAWRPPAPFTPRAEARRRLGIEPETFAIGWVGRLIPVKGPDLLVQALGSVAEGEVSRQRWEAHVIGDGPERGALEALSTGGDLEGRLRVHGAVPDAGLLMPAFDLLVLSSRSEGTPVVLLEAMRAGVPVVAFGVGGVPHMFPSDSAPWITPPGDPGRLAGAIRIAMADEGARMEWGRRVAEHAASVFDPDAWIRAHESVYRAALAARRKHA
jgi:glycosyltransferase involved in cell wall biosynthesis